jgi:sugar diacid utilization regulator
MLEAEGLRSRVECDLRERVALGATRCELLRGLEEALTCRLSVLGPDGGTDDELISCLIAPGTEILGTLQSDIPVSAESPELTECLRYGARVIGIELVREQAARETRWSLEADLLTELIEAGGTFPERLLQRARHAGFDLALPWHILLVASGDRPVSMDLVAAARRPASSAERSMSCVLSDQLAIAVCGEPSNARDDKLRYMHRVARGVGVPVRIGVSSGATDFARGFRQARAAMRLATCSAEPGTVFYGDLGSLRFLVNGPNEDELVSMVNTHIGPLASHDRMHHGELLHTLRVYLSEGGNRRRTAERCHVHQSTIRYRLRRIRELLDCDLADADVRFDLMLSLKVFELLQTVEPETPGRALQIA